MELTQGIALPPDRDILHTIPQEFIVDTLEKIENPIGLSGRRLEGHVHLVTAATSAMKNLVESAEEVGINIHNIEYVTNQPWPFPSSLMIGLKAETDQISLNIDKNELEDAVWLSKKDLKTLLTSNLKDMEPARPGTIARYLLESWVQNSI